jgi:phage gpG-like protein
MSDEFRLGSEGDAARMERRLASPESLLKRWGALMVRESSRAFAEQSFDGQAWSPRYPNRGEPVVNIAGILSDFARGKNPPARRFQSAPALVDTNDLRRSLTYEVSAKQGWVDVGSWQPYASTHQEGGTTTQAVTDTARRNLAAFLRTRRGARYRGKLGFLFHRDTLETRVVARPFVGITSTTAPMLTSAAARWLAGGRAA